MSHIFPIDDGFVRLVDSMGDDKSVVRAARVSYGKESKGEEADRKLIQYLMEHNHGTPFEHIVFTFHVRCPIFVARQWFRHRIGSFNEISGRYTELDTGFFVPTALRENQNDNHQASIEGDFSDEEIESMMREWNYALEIVEDTYNSLLEKGLAREQASKSNFACWDLHRILLDSQSSFFIQFHYLENRRRRTGRNATICECCSIHSGGKSGLVF